jgi:hypothetical protein
VKLKVADFYYGAVLSLLFNTGVDPALVESSNSRQIYDFTTDNVDFRIFIKYRTRGRLGVGGNYRSWQFTFSNTDLEEMFRFIKEDRNLLLALVCGEEKLNESEYAVLNSEEIKQCLGNDKTSITISRLKGEKAFRISIGGGRDSSLKIPSNRVIK